MIKKALLIATALHQVEGIKSPLPTVTDFKCVSQTAFRKFDNYLGKVMNRAMTDNVIYCDEEYCSNDAADEVSFNEARLLSTKEL